MSKVKGIRDYSNKYNKVPSDPKPPAPGAPTGKGNPNLKSRFDKLGGYSRKGEKVFPGRGEMVAN